MTDLATIIALREAWIAANNTVAFEHSAYYTALDETLDADFPSHPTTGNNERHWCVYNSLHIELWFGCGRDGAFSWMAAVRVSRVTRSHATGPTPYAAVTAALDALDDTEARDALRAAVEATR